MEQENIQIFFNNFKQKDPLQMHFIEVERWFLLLSKAEFFPYYQSNVQVLLSKQILLKLRSKSRYQKIYLKKSAKLYILFIKQKQMLIM